MSEYFNLVAGIVKLYKSNNIFLCSRLKEHLIDKLEDFSDAGMFAQLVVVVLS